MQRKWMTRPSVTFGRARRGTVQHVCSDERSACGTIRRSEMWAQSDQPGYFKLPVCQRCVSVVTTDLNSATRLADAVYVAAHKEGMGGR